MSKPVSSRVSSFLKVLMALALAGAGLQAWAQPKAPPSASTAAGEATAPVKPAAPGQKVHIASIPGPTGFGFGSLDQPMRAARRMRSSGPVPSATVASPIHARRRSLKRLRNGSGAGSVTAPRGYATGCAPSGDPNAGNSPD